MSDEYAVGQQPCQNLKRKPSGIPAAPDMPNVHQCYRCGGEVSFCENCCRDHHRGGYESCQPTCPHCGTRYAAGDLHMCLDTQEEE